MRPQTARVELDPVALDRGAAIRPRGRACRAQCTSRPARAEHALEALRAVDRPRVDDGAAACEQRCLHPGRGSEADLDRLAVRSERPARAARAQQRHRDRVVALGVRQAKQPRRRDRRTDRPAHGRGVPAGVVQRRVARSGDRRHRLEPGRVGIERRLQRQAELCGEHQCRRRARRADVRDPV